MREIVEIRRDMLRSNTEDFMVDEVALLFDRKKICSGTANGNTEPLSFVQSHGSSHLRIKGEELSIN